MTVLRTFSLPALLAAVALSLACGSALATGKTHKAKAKPAAESVEAPAETIAYTQVGLANSAFQNFIHWDDKAVPLFYGMPDSLERYSRYFQPAFGMGNNKPAAPATEVFQKEQILVVARIVTAPADGSSTFKVESLTEKNQVLELRYSFTPAEKTSTYSKSDGLALQIAKRPLKQVLLIENGKPVGSLNLQAGQWTVDASSSIVPVPPPAAPK